MMLTIQKLRDGGYIVADLNLLNPNRLTDFMFASADIDEALAYIKAQMTKEPSDAQ